MCLSTTYVIPVAELLTDVTIKLSYTKLYFMIQSQLLFPLFIIHVYISN